MSDEHGSTKSTIIFLHYWGKGPADKLAMGFKAALDEFGRVVSNNSPP